MFKGCLVLLLAGVSITRSYTLDVCEYQLNGTRLAHPADCNKFIVCKNGQTQSIRNCPIGLHFNRFKGVCDLRERAACDVEFVQLADKELHCVACCSACSCNSTPSTTPTEAPPCPNTPIPEIPNTPVTTPPETPECPETSTPEIPENPATPSPEVPQSPGTSTPEIPENPATPTPEVPESPDTPTPGIPVSPGTPTAVTPESPVTPTPEIPVTPELNCSNNSTVCVGKPDGSVLHVNGTCNQYIVCVGSCTNILSCPNNLQYNMVTKQCDYPQNVNCPWQSKPPVTGPSGVTCAQPGKCAGKADGILLPDPNSNGYIVCQCECEIERPCPTGTKFDETLQVCGHIKNNGIGNNGGNGNGESGGGSIEGNGNGNGNSGGNGNGNDNENNGENINGNNGGSGHEKNENNGNGNVNSNQKICTNNITACQNQTDGTQLPVEEICNKFYVCNYNCATEIHCPNNLIYNPNKKYCDYPQNYNCPWPYTPPSGANAGPSGIACASGGRCIGKPDGTFFASVENQAKYVICQCECEVELNCPVGLVWDNKLLSCNFPANNI